MSQEQTNKERVVSVSVIDYIGKMGDGITLLLSVMIFDQLYEVAYWFNREGKIKIVPEDKMLKKLNVESIYKYEHIEDLIMVIHSNIPNVDKILDEFIP